MANLGPGRLTSSVGGPRKAIRLLLTFSIVSAIALAQTGGAAVHQAAKEGDAVKIKSLLDAGPGLVGARDGAGRTPLITAAFWSQAEPAESSPYLAGIGEYGEKLQAEYRRPADTAKVLLAAGAAPDARDNEDYTALHWAAMRGNKALIEVLVAAGAAVDAADRTFKATPLHLAVRAGHLSAAAALIEAGADPRLKDTYGRTPLYYAESSGNAEMAKLLRRRPQR